MRRAIIALASGISLLGLIGCGPSVTLVPSIADGKSPAGSGSASSGGAASGSAASTGSASGTSAAYPDAGTIPPWQPGPGILTAGVWDDSLNYGFFTKYLASHPQIDGDPGFATSDYDSSKAEFAQRIPRSVVDAALVIDTTGSMADEIAYLTAEFANIAEAIHTKFPNSDQHWALVVYRDTPDTDPGDEYVFRTYNFTADTQAFASTVAMQHAANGGDYPESPEIGLEQLPQLAWRTGPTVAKIAFWVADAPHHSYRAAAMKQAIMHAHGAGVHLYPVSGSGTDDLLELTMRSAAEITGGRYLFLTSDSGVGGPHKTPEIPCYFVSRLEKALLRVVSMELSGNYEGPDPADVIRTSGSPASDGTCLTEDGQTVRAF